MSEQLLIITDILLKFKHVVANCWVEKIAFNLDHNIRTFCHITI